MCTYPDTAFPPRERRPECKVRHYAARRPFFFFVVFEPRIVNPPLPLVFMQNHPFIPRHACLAAISCPPAPPAALCLSLPPPLFCPRCILITRTCFPSLAARSREICLSISRQPRVNQHPLTPVLPGRPRHTFSPITSARISEFAPLSPFPPCCSHLTYRYLTEMRLREGREMILISLR